MLYQQVGALETWQPTKKERDLTLSYHSKTLQCDGVEDIHMHPSMRVYPQPGS